MSWWCAAQGVTTLSQERAQYEASSESGLAAIKVARIFEEDRLVRVPGTIPPERERALGRVWCVVKAFPKGSTPTKATILARTHWVATAFLAFDDDVAVVSRHIFLDEFGSQINKVSNCFFEHLESGDIVPFVRTESAPHPKMGRGIPEQNEDVAVVKLARVPGTGTDHVGMAIPIEGVEIDADLGGRPLEVVSNYANNLPPGMAPDTKTITSCEVITRNVWNSGKLSHSWGTYCDTGAGSSGSPVFSSQFGKTKLVGVVAGESSNGRAHDGEWFDPDKDATYIITFDQSLLAAYGRLSAGK